MRLISIALAVSLCLPAVAGDTLTVTFVGDVLLDRGVRQHIARHGVDALFSESVDSVFRQSDYVVANLECPVTEVRRPLQKHFCFRGDPEWLTALQVHGITHLNLANNHSIDQGRSGLMDTHENIRRAGMTAFGAGASMSEAAAPAVLCKFGSLGASDTLFLLASNRLALESIAYLPDHPSVSQEPMADLLQRVRELRHQHPACRIIVSLHWGAEHQSTPVPSQRLEARRMIDAGADALICHHPHTLQTIEHYRGRPIYYSIGNFIFDQTRPLNTRACMVKVTVTPAHISFDTIPVLIDHCVPRVTTT